VLVALVFVGGLVFNVGNVAGCGLGLAVYGLPAGAGAAISAALVVLLLASPRAGVAMDGVARGRRGAAVAAFVAVSLGLFLCVGRPVRLLILAGYRHPRWLAAAGGAALLGATAAAVLSLGELGRL
jgi:hypothetical protein